MPTVITGIDGINQVQAGAVESGDLPAGSVIQVVQETTSTTVVTTTAGNFIDTDLSASITPQSANSKILVLANQSTRINADDDKIFFGLRLLRDSSIVYQGAETGSGYPYDVTLRSTGLSNLRIDHIYSIMVLDAAGSTASLTYKTQGTLGQTTGNAQLAFQQSGSPNGTSYITLMEIAG